MPKTYAAIRKQIATLEAEADKAKKREAEGVIERIKVAIRAYGITSEDLGLTGRRATKAASKHAKSSRPIKYRDEAGNTWVGIGKPPLWWREAMANGRKAVEFLMSGAGSTRAAKSTPKANGTGGRSGKKKRGGAVRYRDGQGNTWSGFGRQPGWLKTALASGKTIESFKA